MLKKAVSIMVSVVLAVGLCPGFAVASETVAAAPAAMSTQASKSKVTWYSFALNGAHIKTAKASFSTKCKTYSASSLKGLLNKGYKTLKSKKRTFKVAKTVKFCGSDWSSLRPLSRAEAIAKLKSLKGETRGVAYIKVKDGYVAELRLGVG